MRTVIKIGSSTLTYPTGQLNIRRVEQLCKVMSDLKNGGAEIVLVSSGAIAMGVGKMRLKSRPEDIPGKQAAAAVGQCELMDVYDRFFSTYHHTPAQILLTSEDLRNEERHANFRNTVERLLSWGVIPVINENDTVVTDEIKVGDNDTLSAQVAVSMKADLLILLSDIDGLYTADPHKDKSATVIHRVAEISPEILAMGGDSVSGIGTGGMRTKLQAACLCTAAGCDMLIMNGAEPELLYDAMEGKEVGTRFLAEHKE